MQNSDLMNMREMSKTAGLPLARRLEFRSSPEKSKSPGCKGAAPMHQETHFKKVWKNCPGSERSHSKISRMISDYKFKEKEGLPSDKTLGRGLKQ
jgi:hypothetical protein